MKLQIIRIDELGKPALISNWRGLVSEETFGSNRDKPEVTHGNKTSRFECKLMMPEPTAHQVVNFVQKRF